jgi:hypothetical protein
MIAATEYLRDYPDANVLILLIVTISKMLALIYAKPYENQAV